MIDTIIFRNILKVIKNQPDKTQDIIDSFSDNQFLAKETLIDHLEMIGIDDREIVILGSWYGSILLPSLAPRAKKITCIDLDEQALKISKAFFQYDNVDYVVDDAFERNMERYHATEILINTSCEHMPPMNTWPFWKDGMYFAMTSNNMYNIEGHVNCVDTM